MLKYYSGATIDGLNKSFYSDEQMELSIVVNDEDQLQAMELIFESDQNRYCFHWKLKTGASFFDATTTDSGERRKIDAFPTDEIIGKFKSNSGEVDSEIKEIILKILAENKQLSRGPSRKTGVSQLHQIDTGSSNIFKKIFRFFR